MAINNLTELNQWFEQIKGRLQISEDLLSYLDLFRLTVSVNDSDVSNNAVQIVQKLNAVYNEIAVNEGFIYNVTLSEGQELSWRGLSLRKGSIIIKTFKENPILVESPDPITYVPSWDEDGKTLSWIPIDPDELPENIESLDLTGEIGSGIYTYEYTPDTSDTSWNIEITIPSSLGLNYFPIYKMYDVNNEEVFADITVSKDSYEITISGIPAIVTKVVVH